MITLDSYFPFAPFFRQFAEVFLIWGWLLILFLALWIAWSVYLLIKRIDYVSAIQWTFLQITIPAEAPQTPKAMEQAFDVWSGLHKGPDIVERLFEGYMHAWYSCELVFTLNQVKYIMVVPTAHRQFFEGVIYGQYPTADIQETEDYSLKFPWQELEKNFDLYGVELKLAKEDYYPIRIYSEYEDKLAEDDKYIDPHQSLVDALTNINPGEHFWVQILVRPMDYGENNKMVKKGSKRIAELSGQDVSEPPDIQTNFKDFVTAIPGELFEALTRGPIEIVSKEEKKREIKFPNALEDAEMKGILQKISHTAFKTKIRIMYLCPMGKFHKPNQGKLIGVFKQFSTFNLNSFKLDAESKTSGPGFFMKNSRRYWRKRKILINYQERDFWGDNSGQWFTAQELATLFHFPGKYARSPSITRATSGLSSAPENVPYV